MGAGDEVPGSLRQIGCDVTMLSAEDLSHGDLSRYDAIVTGVRAWNTRVDLRANYQRLFDYVSNGGTVIAEYSRPEGGGGGGRGGQGGGPNAGQAGPGQGASATAPDGQAAAQAPAANGNGGRGGRGGGRGRGAGPAPPDKLARRREHLPRLRPQLRVDRSRRNWSMPRECWNIWDPTQFTSVTIA